MWQITYGRWGVLPTREREDDILLAS